MRAPPPPIISVQLVYKMSEHTLKTKEIIFFQKQIPYTILHQKQLSMFMILDMYTFVNAQLCHIYVQDIKNHWQFF